jgi:hypothetical protein
MLAVKGESADQEKSQPRITTNKKFLCCQGFFSGGKRVIKKQGKVRYFGEPVVDLAADLNLV